MLRHVAVAVLGGGVALSAVAVHRTIGLGLPLGLLLAYTGSLGTAWWLRTSRRPRLAVSYAGGWLVVVGLAMLGRPEGDYALAADVRGYLMSGASLGVLGIAFSALAAPARD